ncbi:conjugal transfer protein TraN [Rubrivivax gelatinosus]|uniref:conjugal transfer protein TraN n=1 Tax=Rubrivivax gelatinosus TaxID=28068 RepID=UPI0005C22C04|nr:conjugal transfer protein TraN [Rubrivivax gelatinosus]
MRVSAHASGGLLAAFSAATLLYSSAAVAADCRYVGKTCVEGPETRNIGGTPYYLDCWKYQNQYECLKPDSTNYCAALMDTPSCYQTSNKCIRTLFDGTCGVERRTYRCDDPNKPAPANTVVLDKTYTLVDEIDTAQCDALSDNKRCQRASHTCVEPAETRTVQGVKLYKDCWRWEDQYSCVATSPTNDCEKLKSDPACTYESESCVETDPKLGCILKDVRYSCVTKAGSTNTVQDCSTRSACVGETCWDTGSPADGDFAQAVIANEIARQGGMYATEDFKLFNGVKEECREGWGGLKKCCKESPGAKSNNDILMKAGFSGLQAVGKQAANVGSKYVFDYMYQGADWIQMSSKSGAFAYNSVTGDIGAFQPTNFQPSFELYGFGWSAGAAPTGATTFGNGFYFDPYSFMIAVAIMVITDLMSCEPSEQQLGMHRQAGLSIYVGAYCSKKTAGACVQESQVYCSYNSKLARILSEQGRKQINRPFAPGGDAKKADCSGFTTDEFAALDFSKIDLSEFVDDVMNATQSPDGKSIADTLAGRLSGKSINNPNDATPKMPFGLQ